MCVCARTRTHTGAQLCPTLCDPMDSSHPGSSVHGISQAEHWSGLPLPTPGDSPNPGMEPVSLVSPALQVDSLPLSHQGGPLRLEEEFRKSSSGLFRKMSRTCREEGRGKGHAEGPDRAGPSALRSIMCQSGHTGSAIDIPLVLLTFQFPRLIHDSMLVTYRGSFFILKKLLLSPKFLIWCVVFSFLFSSRNYLFIFLAKWHAGAYFPDQGSNSCPLQ